MNEASQNITLSTSSMFTRVFKHEGLKGLDVPLLLVVFALLMLGLVMVTSAGVSNEKVSSEFFYFQRQFIMSVVAVCTGGLLFFFVPTSNWLLFSRLLFVLCGIGLLAPLLPGLGVEVNGARRWVRLAGQQIQPSEFFKIATILYVAGYLVRHRSTVREQLSGILLPALMITVCAGVLAAFQKDFGGAFVVIVVSFTMLFLGGTHLLSLIIFGSILSVGAIGMLIFFPYRLARLQSFIDPWDDPFDSDFQLSQALMAIGSGGWSGEGIGSSILKLSFLPEGHNDFVFALFAEEFGFFGVVVLVLLFSWLIYRCFKIANDAANVGFSFGAYFSIGVAICLTIQVGINLGMNMAMLPTKGITLPFISYGGSSLIASCIMIGLLLRVTVDTELYRLARVAQVKQPRKKRHG